MSLGRDMGGQSGGRPRVQDWDMGKQEPLYQDHGEGAACIMARGDLAWRSLGPETKTSLNCGLRAA